MLETEEETKIRGNKYRFLLMGFVLGNILAVLILSLAVSGAAPKFVAMYNSRVVINDILDTAAVIGDYQEGDISGEYAAEFISRKKASFDLTVESHEEMLVETVLGKVSLSGSEPFLTYIESLRDMSASLGEIEGLLKDGEDGKVIFDLFEVAVESHEEGFVGVLK